MSTVSQPADDTMVERITHAQAAALLGCHPSNIAKLVKKGHLTATGVRGPDPSLDLDEVVQLREQRIEAERQRRLRYDRVDPRPQGPPAELGDHEWLSVPQVALRLGRTQQAVRARAQRGTIPHERHDGRIWIRADHLEVWQQARRVTGPDALPKSAPEVATH